ncbi:hypothetical protein BT96DRAFT_974928 [Gymnopus androsaceus JB14]|uniref:Mid2 domain-containing protein n=1 Tax=Gymnopus androsaceus JB14 TaxID=1447944 RepID=A0A6A4HQ62_9AGAR|nr:hypothetical protein BT96DRAFT_974928 [Gymnopus androsaceus JB14]
MWTVIVLLYFLSGLVQGKPGLTIEPTAVVNDFIRPSPGPLFVGIASLVGNALGLPPLVQPPALVAPPASTSQLSLPSSKPSSTTNLISSTTSGTPTFSSSAQSLSLITPISSDILTLSQASDSGESTPTVVSSIPSDSGAVTATSAISTVNVTATGASSSDTSAHAPNSKALLVGAILGSLVPFLVVAALVFFLWRRRRIRHQVDKMNVTFYPDQMMAIPSKSLAPSDWVAFDDGSSLTPSALVSRDIPDSSLVQIRPLFQSLTTITTITTASDLDQIEPPSCVESGTFSETSDIAGQ